MIIDIEPIIIKANNFERTCIEMREIDALYEIRFANGGEFSTQWDKKSFDEFLPKKTISEMLTSWEETIKRRYDEAVNAIETGIHPTWERDEREYHPITKVWTGKMIGVPYKLDKNQIQGWKRIAENLEKKLGKLIFVKIVVE